MNKEKTIKKNVDKEKSGENLQSRRLIESLKAVGISFLVGFILIIISGQGSELLKFITSIVTLSFNDLKTISDFLGRLSYLIPLGLSLVVSFRIGVFNIGASGQAMAGGLISFVFATKINVGGIGFIFTILIGVIIGMLVALLIAFLKNKFNINEVISSIMLNWIFFYLIKFTSYYGESWTILSGNDLRMSWLSSIFNDPHMYRSINIGIIISIILIPILWFLYSKTTWGFKQEILGNNSNVAKYIGINQKAEIYKSMLISGGLAGLAGTIYIVGVSQSLPIDSITDIPSWTFDGITISLLGFNSPIGIIGSSILMALLTSPTNDLDLVIGGIKIVNVMISIMIILIARSNYRILYGKRQDTMINYFKNKFKSKKKSEEN